jgi:hypothetical protein
MSGNINIQVDSRQLWYSVCFVRGVNLIFKYYPTNLTEVLTTLTDVYLCFFLSCKANARV